MISRWGALVVFAVALAGFAKSTQAQSVITTYRCVDGTEVPVAFFQGDRRAHLQLDGKALTLPRSIGVSGRRYAKGGVSMTIKGPTASLRRGGKTTQCRVE